MVSYLCKNSSKPLNNLSSSSLTLICFYQIPMFWKISLILCHLKRGLCGVNAQTKKHACPYFYFWLGHDNFNMCWSMRRQTFFTLSVCCRSKEYHFHYCFKQICSWFYTWIYAHSKGRESLGDKISIVNWKPLSLWLFAVHVRKGTLCDIIYNFLIIFLVSP